MKPEPSRSVRKWILPLDRRLCSHPLMVTVFAFVLADVLDVDVHTRLRSSRSRLSLDHAFHPRAAPSRARASVSLVGSARGELEYQRAVVPDFLHAPSTPPASRSYPRTARGDRRRGRGCRARGSTPGVPTRLRSRRRGRLRGARGRSRGRCRSRPTRGPLRRSARASPARDRSFGMTSTASRTPSGSAISNSSRRCGGRRRGCCRRIPLCVRGQPRWTTSTFIGMRRAICSARSTSAMACARAFGVGAGDRHGTRRAGRRAGSLTGACTLCSSRPRLGEPLLQVGDDRRVVVVEVRPRGEHLDGLEPVRRDLEHVVARQSLVAVEMRRHAELSLGPREPQF